MKEGSTYGSTFASPVGRILVNIPAYFWLAIFIRMLLMALSAHNDALFIPWLSYPILEGHLDLYDFLASVRRETPVANLRQLIWAPNPPLTYFTIAGWMYVLKTLHLLDLRGWHYNNFSAQGLIFPIRMLFFTKLLYLAAELGSWRILRGFIPVQRLKLFDLLWLFSPIIWIGVYVMGQTDILAIFWVIVSLALAKKSFDGVKRQNFYGLLAMVCLGISAAYKLWPLLLVIFWVIVLGKRGIPFLGLLLCAFFPLLVSVVPFLSSVKFQEWVIFGHGTTFITLGDQIWIQRVSPFIILWGIAVIYSFFSEARFDLLWKSSLFVLTGFFTLNPFWEFYWLIWLLPFSLLAIAYVPPGIWSLLVQTFHYFLYMIGEWNLGITAFNVGFREMKFSGLTLQQVLFFPEYSDRIYLILSISYSTFFLASWALFVLVWFYDLLPAVFRSRSEQNQVTWPAWVPPVLFFAYLFGVFHYASEQFNRIPVFSLLRTTLRTFQIDVGFSVFYAGILFIVLCVWLFSVVGKTVIPRKHA